MTTNSQLFDGIYIFYQVVRCGSFTACANYTGHSTSYISKEINKLEQRLAVRLLNRTTRSISLTPEGEVFFEQSQLLIENAEHAQGLLTSKQDSPHGLLKISCPVDFGLNYLKPIIDEYLNSYPDVSLDLDLNDRHVDVIQEGIDIAIRATAALDDSSLISRKIFQSNSYTLASKQYIQRFGKPKQPQDLSKHACICYKNHKTPTKWQYITANNETLNVDVNKRILSNNAQMQLSLAQAGHGICVLPKFCLGKDFDDTQLVALFEDYQSPKIDVFAVYPSRKYVSAKVRCLIDLLVQHLR